MRLFSVSLVMIGAVQLTVGCGAKKTLERLSKHSDKASSNAEGQQLANGTRVAETEMPPIVTIVSLTSQCTGTFIGPNTVLTAAHCIQSLNADEYVVFTGYQFKNYAEGKFPKRLGLKVVGIKSAERPPASVPIERYRSTDIALLYTEKESPGGYYKISESKPVNQTSVLSVGYGKVQRDGDTNFYPNKGFQTVVTEPGFARSSFAVDVIFTASTPNGPFNLSGDSGGPILVSGGKVGGVDSWMIAGVHSGWVTADNGDNIGINASLNSDFAKNFINEAVASGHIIGKDIPKTESVPEVAVNVPPPVIPAPVPLPIPPLVVTCTSVPSLYNSANAFDVNNDGFVSPLDLLLVINAMNQAEPDKTKLVQLKPSDSAYFIDVSGDGCLSIDDVNLVQRKLNAR